MRTRISKTFDFDAAHWLPNVPEGHRCRRLHGHTYRVEIICEGKPDARGMVVDYAEIAEAWKPLDKMLDHHCLNEVPGLENPTTELLAAFVWAVLVSSPLPVVRLRVYESATTWCEVGK